MLGFLRYESNGVPFDSARSGIFHHAFYVHAPGASGSRFSHASTQMGNPIGYNANGACAVPDRTPNPLFNVPKAITGVAQPPGQRLMISTGLWDPFNGVASDELVASTTLHEAGHNSDLYHGAQSPVKLPASETCAVHRNELQTGLHEHHELPVPDRRRARRPGQRAFRLLARRVP